MNQYFGLFWLLLAVEIGVLCAAISFVRQNKKISLFCPVVLAGILAARFYTCLNTGGWTFTAITGVELLILIRLQLASRNRSDVKSPVFSMFLLSVCLIASIGFLVLSSVAETCKNQAPFLELTSLTTAPVNDVIIGNDPELSDLANLASYSDNRHARIFRKNDKWFIQNMSFRFRLIIRHHKSDVDPHELPLELGQTFSINDAAFTVMEQTRFPFYSRMKLKGPDNRILTADSLKPMVIDSVNTLKSDGSAIPITNGKQFARIRFNHELQLKIPFIHQFMTFTIPGLEAILWTAMLPFIWLLFTSKRKLVRVAALCAAAGILIFLYVSLYDKDSRTGRFVLSHYLSGDKTTAVIKDHHNNNLIERNVPLESDDIIIMGYTHYRFLPKPDGSFSLRPIERSPRFKLPESGSFMILNTFESWNSAPQVLIPFKPEYRIQGEITGNKGHNEMRVGVAGDKVENLTSGETFMLRDKSGNLAEFLFRGRFIPASIMEWVVPKESLAMSKILFKITLTLLLFILAGILLTVFGKLNGQTLPIFAGTMLLSGIGIVFLFRLELAGFRHTGIVNGHLNSMRIAIAVMLLASILSSFAKWLQNRSLKRQRRSEQRKRYFSAQMIDEIDRKLNIMRGKGWEIYNFFGKKRKYSINLPSLALLMLLPLFFAQKLCGSEVGINFIAFSVQPVFPVLIVMAFVLAFGTTEDLVIPELNVKSLIGRLWKRYSDLLWCCLFFFSSLLMVHDLSPIFLFFWILVIAWFLRSRFRSWHFAILILVASISIIYGLLKLDAWLPYLPQFLQNRLGSWFKPFEYTTYAGQFIDNLWMLKNAGLTGSGLGISPNVQGLAQVADDFVLSLVLADTGIPGLLALIVSFSLIIGPAFLFSCQQSTGSDRFLQDHRANETFYRTLVFWLAMMFLVQLFMVVCMVTGMLPIMGFPAPFLAKGGSSLVAFSFVSVGVMMMAMGEL